MKRIFVLSLLVLLTVVFSASAQRLTPEEVGKEVYYEAVKAYESGTYSRAQLDILHRTNYFNRFASPQRDFGGPDPFGNTWIDSNEPDGPDFSWVDISGIGTNIAPDMGDDDYQGPFALGFNFNFYGQSYSNVYIQSNGTLCFEDGYISYTNQALPFDTVNDNDATIFWMWTDLDPDYGADGQIYYATTTVGGRTAFVVSFVNVAEYPWDDTAEHFTGQVILFEDGEILFQYDYFEPGFDMDTETLGIQNNDLTAYLQMCNEGDVYLEEDLAVSIIQTDPDASLSGYVYDDATNAPIGGATVHVGGATTTTDNSGFYQLLEIYSGTWNYLVSAPDYWELEGTLTVDPGVNTHDFYLEFFEAPDILIFDGDPVPGSAAICQAVFEDLGFTTYYTTQWDEVPWSAFEAVFCFLGIYPNYFPIYTGDAIETQMVNYLNGGGNLYLESNDLFAFNSPDNLMALLPLTNLSDGSDDLSNVMGETGTYMEGADMAYTGENSFIDEFNASGAGAIDLLYNPADGAGCGVIHNGDVYNTACFSFEVGMLQPDGDFTLEYLFEGLFDYWGMDTVPDPVEFEMTGQTTQIPPGGGVVTYDVHLVSIINLTVPGVRYWTEVILPNGQAFGPLFTYPFTLMPFMDVTVIGLTQNVPAIAPSGTYTLIGRVGFFAGPYLEDSFVFDKIGVAADGVNNWNPGGSFDLSGNAAASVAIPTEYALQPVFPNPFNPAANVTVTLPEAADLTVTVFNINGQQVAQLTDGQLNAGTHTFTLDGSALASGIYLVKANVPGQLNQVRKVTLLK